jgi:hypothetical protein
MTRLASVDLYLHVDDYDQELRSRFLFRSCYLGNLLTRHVRRLKFNTAGFIGLLVQGRMRPDDVPRISSDRNLIAHVDFDLSRYRDLGPGEHHEFFISMMTAGLEKCARHYDIPLAELLQAIDQFRSGGYKNEWIHQTKLLRGLGLRATLACRLDSEHFTLNLVLERKGTIVFDETILDTLPDSIIFHYRFKEVVVDGTSIVVMDRLGKRLYALDANSLQPAPVQSR